MSKDAVTDEIPLVRLGIACRRDDSSNRGEPRERGLNQNSAALCGRDGDRPRLLVTRSYDGLGVTGVDQQVNVIGVPELLQDLVIENLLTDAAVEKPQHR